MALLGMNESSVQKVGVGSVFIVSEKFLVMATKNTLFVICSVIASLNGIICGKLVIIISFV